MQLDEKSQHLTAFTIPGQGQYHWITSPMGLLGCPASFQRLMEGEDENQNFDANGDDPVANLEDFEAAGRGEVAELDPALAAARAAVEAANNVLAALPAAPQAQQGADPTAVMLANMMHAMQLQNAQTQVYLAQARFDSERQRREDQRRFQIQLEELRRDKGSSGTRVRPPQFDLEKDKGSFLIWKSRWEFHVKDLDTIRDRAVREEKKRAMLQQALSDFTLKWVHNKGFTEENPGEKHRYYFVFCRELSIYV